MLGTNGIGVTVAGNSLSRTATVSFVPFWESGVFTYADLQVRERERERRGSAYPYRCPSLERGCRCHS